MSAQALESTWNSVRSAHRCLHLCTTACWALDGSGRGLAGFAEGNQDLTFTPVVNPSSTRLLEDSTQVPGSFLQRQRFFHDLKLQRMRILHAEVLFNAPAVSSHIMPLHVPL